MLLYIIPIDKRVTNICTAETLDEIKLVKGVLLYPPFLIIITYYNYSTNLTLPTCFSKMFKYRVGHVWLLMLFVFELIKYQQKLRQKKPVMVPDVYCCDVLK